MTLMILVLCSLTLVFGFVILRGAPYLPTRKNQIKAGLELLDLNPGQTMLELGSGDGAVLLAAAKKGYKSIGYELNPVLVIISRLRCFKYRKLITIYWGDYWIKQWPPSDGMFVFLMDKYMKKLDTKITQYNQSVNYKLASHAFKVPGKKITESSDGVHLYIYKN